jgi:hypothetical protein
MSDQLNINVPDKILAGLNQSYTILSELGEPRGRVAVDGRELPHRVIRLGPPKDWNGEGAPKMKYKVSFLLPQDSGGKKLQLRFEAGGEVVEESHDITLE